MKKFSIICLALTIALSLCVSHFALAGGGGGGKRDQEYIFTLKNDSAWTIIMTQGYWNEAFKGGGGKGHNKSLNNYHLAAGQSYRFEMKVKHDSQISAAGLMGYPDLDGRKYGIRCEIREAKNVTCSISNYDIRVWKDGTNVMKNL